MNYINEIQIIEETLGERLADASLISPEDIRVSFASVVNFLKKISPLASGTYTIGDVESTDTIRTVNLPYNVGTSEYTVRATLVSKSFNFGADIDVTECIRDRTPTSFKLCMREFSRDTQNLDFEYSIYPKN